MVSLTTPQIDAHSRALPPGLAGLVDAFDSQRDCSSADSPASDRGGSTARDLTSSSARKPGAGFHQQATDRGLRGFEQSVTGAFLNDASLVENDHAMTETAGDREVVGHEDHCQAQLVLQNVVVDVVKYLAQWLVL